MLISLRRPSASLATWMTTLSAEAICARDDLAARGGATLAGGEEGGLDRDRRRRLDVLGAPHDQRVVAAELEREDLLRRFGELLVNRGAGPRGAGEEKAVDAGLSGERAALVGTADEQAHDPFGDAGLVEAADQEFAHRGRLLGRLEDHCIARNQRRDDVAVGKVRREIVGA